MEDHGSSPTQSGIIATVLALGVLVLTTIAFLLVVDGRSREATLREQNDTALLGRSARAEIERYLSVLRAAQGYLTASEFVTRDEWVAFQRGLRIHDRYLALKSIRVMKLHEPNAGEAGLDVTSPGLLVSDASHTSTLVWPVFGDTAPRPEDGVPLGEAVALATEELRLSASSGEIRGVFEADYLCFVAPVFAHERGLGLGDAGVCAWVVLELSTKRLAREIDSSGLAELQTFNHGSSALGEWGKVVEGVPLAQGLVISRYGLESSWLSHVGGSALAICLLGTMLSAFVGIMAFRTLVRLQRSEEDHSRLDAERQELLKQLHAHELQLVRQNAKADSGLASATQDIERLAKVLRTERAERDCARGLLTSGFVTSLRKFESAIEASNELSIASVQNELRAMRSLGRFIEAFRRVWDLQDGAGNLKVESISLLTVVEGVVEEARCAFNGCRCERIISDLLTVEADRGLLREVLWQLVMHLCKTQPRPERFQILADRTTEGVRIQILAILPKAQPLMSPEAEPVPEDAIESPSIAFCREAVQLHDGYWKVLSPRAFSFTLPERTQRE